MKIKVRSHIARDSRASTKAKRIGLSGDHLSLSQTLQSSWCGPICIHKKSSRCFKLLSCGVSYGDGKYKAAFPWPNRLAHRGQLLEYMYSTYLVTLGISKTLGPAPGQPFLEVGTLAPLTGHHRLQAAGETAGGSLG
jgi:hypothetical protein